MKVTRALKNRINAELTRFCSKWRTVEEWRELLDSLYDNYGLTFLLTGYPRSEVGSKYWSVPYEINDDTAENSVIVVSMYESSRTDKKEYNMYVS